MPSRGPQFLLVFCENTGDAVKISAAIPNVAVMNCCFVIPSPFPGLVRSEKTLPQAQGRGAAWICKD